jgi:hypothetical protein
MVKSTLLLVTVCMASMAMVTWRLRQNLTGKELL